MWVEKLLLPKTWIANLFEFEFESTLKQTGEIRVYQRLSLSDLKFNGIHISLIDLTRTIFLQDTHNNPHIMSIVSWMTDQCLCHDCTVYNRASISGMTSYRQSSWSLEAARFDIVMIVSLWHFTDISAALLPMCLSNFRAIGKVLIRIPRLRDFTRSWRVQNSSTPTDFRAGNRRVHLQAVELSNQPWAPSQYKDRLIYVWRFPC